MKRVLWLVAITLCFMVTGFAQSDNEKISYQAVVRDSENHLVYNTELTVTVGIANVANAPFVYEERHDHVMSNANGLISLLIGDGTRLSGSWEDIRWNSAVVTAVIRDASTQEVLAEHVLPLQAVPYALYADYADSTDLSAVREEMAETAGQIRNQITADSLTLAARMDTVYKHLCDSVMACEGIRTMQTDITDVQNNLDSTKVNIRNEISTVQTNVTDVQNNLDSTKVNIRNEISTVQTNVTNVQNNLDSTKVNIRNQMATADNNLSNRIHTDSIALVNRIVTDSTALARRMDTLLTHVCDSVMNCGEIQAMQTTIQQNQTAIQNANTRIYNDSTFLKGLIDNNATSINNLQTADNNLSTRIHNDSLKLANNYYNKAKINDTVTYILNRINGATGELTNYYTKHQVDSIAHADSLVLVNRIKADSSALATRIKADSTALATRMDTVYKHLCDSVMKCDGITSMQTSIQQNQTAIQNANTRIYNDSTYLKGLIDNNATGITNLQNADNNLSNRIHADSIALATRMDTVYKHLCDSVMKCDGITSMQTSIQQNQTAIQNANNRIYNDSTFLKGLIDDNATSINNLQTADNNLSTRIHNDSLKLVDIKAKVKADSTTLATRMDTVYKHLCDSVMKCDGITTMQTAIQNANNRIYNDSTFLKGLIDNNATSINNLQTADNNLSTRIHNDSLKLANNYYNKAKINDTVTYILNRINGATGELSNYYTKHQVDSIAHADSLVLVNRIKADSTALATRMDTVYKHLCDSVMKCDGITSMQTAIQNANNRIYNDSTYLKGLIDANATSINNLQTADNNLSTRIHNDSLKLVEFKAKEKADSSALATRIKADSTTLATRMDTVYKHLCDSVMKCDGITSMQTSIQQNQTAIQNANNRIYNDSTYLKGLIDNNITSINNLQTADNNLSNRIHNDSLKLVDFKAKVKTDSATLANRIHTDSSALATRIKADSIALATRMDTVYKHLCDSVMKCDGITSMQTSIQQNQTAIQNANNRIYNDSTYLKGLINNNATNITHLQTADNNLSNRIHNDSLKLVEFRAKEKADSSTLATRIYTDSTALHKAIKDTATAIRNSIGNGTLTINVNDNNSNTVYSTTTFKANTSDNSTVELSKVAVTGLYNDLVDKPTMPTLPENIAITTANNNFSGANTFSGNNNFSGANDFTGHITVPSNGTAIPRPADSNPASCNNNNAVAVCDLLAVFDSLSNRIKKLEDELAAMNNQPATSAVSVTLNEITRTSLKATATMNDPNLNVTSYQFCISESASMSSPTCSEPAASNEYTFTDLDPNTVYYVTVKAFHSNGTATSDVASGKTLPLTLAISISPASPVCLCDGNPTTVAYTAHIEDGNMADYTFTWSVPTGNPTPDNSEGETCNITYSVAASSYKVTCTATLNADNNVTLTADTTITVQNCTSPAITTCEKDLTIEVTSVTGSPDFIDWKDGATGNSVSKGSTHTYDDPGGVYEIEVSQDGCPYIHKVAVGNAALYPCSVSDAHINDSEYTGTSAASPGTGGLETTNSEGKVTHVADQDGNTYPVVQIGSQCWMAKNLRTTHFSDGEEMVLTELVTTDQYNCYPSNQSFRYAPALGMDYLSSRGYHYNWQSAMHGTTNQGVCPKGWHLPSKEEWETMATVVNGSEVVFPYENHTVQAGTLAGKLSSGCTWGSDESESSTTFEEGSPLDYENPELNASGFSSIPTGYVDGSLVNLSNNNTYAYYWSSTINPNNSAKAYVLWWRSHYNYISLASGIMMGEQQIAVSVRCLRDGAALTPNPTLSVTPSATSTSFCPNSPSDGVTYTAAVIVNGETRTNDYSYTWKKTNTKTNTTETLTNNSSEVIITFNDSADYRVSCVAHSSTPGDTAAHSVMTMVRPKAAPSFNIANVSGFTVTLNNIANTNQIVWDNVNNPTITENIASNQTSATHPYSASGNYQIKAYSADGCSLTKDVAIQVASLSIGQSDPSISDCGTTITYTATLSSNATTDSYHWSVTEGPADGFDVPASYTTTNNQFSVTFRKAGDYKVSCNVTTSIGDASNLVMTSITELDKPDFTTPVAINGATVRLNELTYTNQVIWDFVNNPTNAESLNGYPDFAEHTYIGEPDNYNYTIILKNTGTGCSKTVEGVQVTIPAPAPSLSIGQSEPSISNCGTTITYTATLTNANAASYAWNVETLTVGLENGFDEPTSYTTNPFSVTFKKAGDYKVSCTVTTTSAEDVSSFVETGITELDKPDFTTPVAINGATVRLNELTYTNQVIWDFVNNPTNAESLNGYPDFAEHTYIGEPGNYNYTIILKNTGTGCSKTVENVAVTIPQSSSGDDVNPLVDKKSSCVIKKQNNKLEESDVTSISSPTTWTSTSGWEKGRQDNTYYVIDSVQDADNNWYPVVHIGSQCWMKKNLRTKRYNSNTQITQENTVTSALTKGVKQGRCYLPYNSDNVEDEKKYGLYYNWYAVNTGICPSGWHVPDDAEWSTMEGVVNSSTLSSTVGYRGSHAGKLATCASPWISDGESDAAVGKPGNYYYQHPDTLGFQALPAGGYYIINERLYQPVANSYSYSYFWTNGDYGTTDYKYARYLVYNRVDVRRYYFDKMSAFPVRCVRD